MGAHTPSGGGATRASAARQPTRSVVGFIAARSISYRLEPGASSAAAWVQPLAALHRPAPSTATPAARVSWSSFRRAAWRAPPLPRPRILMATRCGRAACRPGQKQTGSCSRAHSRRRSTRSGRARSMLASPLATANKRTTLGRGLAHSHGRSRGVSTTASVRAPIRGCFLDFCGSGEKSYNNRRSDYWLEPDKESQKKNSKEEKNKGGGGGCVAPSSLTG
jgi:hypothetical protein